MFRTATFAFAFLAACSSGGPKVAPATTVGPTGTTLGPSRTTAPGLSTATVVTPIGPKNVLVASTETARARGLMGRATLAPYDGMLFTFGGATVNNAFWMKDTLFPLDIVFVGADGLVVDVKRMVPCPPDSEQCPLYRPASAYVSALELEAGKAAEFGLGIGAPLTVPEG